MKPTLLTTRHARRAAVARALLIGASLAGALLSAPLRAADDEHEVLSARIELSSNDGLQRLPLPLAALQHARRHDWGDVRIVDADGHAVPQAWANEPASATASRWINMGLFTWPRDALGDAPPQSVRLDLDAAGAVLRIEHAAPPASQADDPDDGSATAWLLDLHGWTLMPRTLRLHWSGPSEGLRRQVRVERSEDAQHWEFAGEATLLDAPGQAGRAIVRRDVRLSDTVSAAARFLRLRADQPLRLMRVEAEMIEPPAAAPLERVRVTPAVERDPVDDQLVWLMDLKGPVPVRQMQIHLPGRNRLLALEIAWRQSPQDPWRFVAQHTAFSLLRDGQTVVSAPFEVAAPPARYWRIASRRGADNGAGSSGLESADRMEVTIAWQAPQLVFNAGGRLPLKLVAGTDTPPPNTLPLFTLIPDYRAGAEYKLPQASLGNVKAERIGRKTTWVQGVRDSAPQAYKRWLLWVLLAAAVVALGLLARKLMRDMRSAGEPQA